VILEGIEKEEGRRKKEEEATSAFERPLHLLCLSARTETALRQVVQRYQQYLAEAPNDLSFADVCFTANSGRAHLSHRLAAVVASAAEAEQALSAFSQGQETTAIIRGEAADGEQPELAFLFTGHGAQYVDMGRQLYQTEPVFRAALDECEALLRPYLERPLLSVMFNSDQVTEDGSQMTIDSSMTYGQPAIFALEYALATLWRSWGVEPTMVLGHSVGEYVAACVAGVFSLADGLKLVAARGRLMDSLPQQGEMVAIFADEARVAEAIAPYAGQVSIAAVNGPTNIVISGEKTAVQTIVTALEAEEVKYRRLAVGVAAHSPLLEPILDAFEQTAAEISYAPPQIGLISCLSDAPFDITTAAYWRHHLRQPVRFADAIQTLYQEGHRHFLEIGPTPVLCGMGQRCLPDNAGGVWLPSLRRDWDDWQQMLESVAALYTQGVAIDWDHFEQPYLEQRQRLPLPTYPWQHQSYWLAEIRAGQPGGSRTPLWETAVAAGEHQADHGPLDLHLDTYGRREECLARLSTAYMVAALSDLGLFTQVDESHTIDSLLTLGQIDASHRSLLARWLQKLAAQDILVAEADGHFTNQAPLPALSPEALLEEALALSPDGPDLPLYVARCGQKLTAVLTGRESPLETLFPGGSYETADYLYHKSPPARYCNGIAREITEALVRSLPPRQPVRIIEVGAGTGGTTAALLPVRPPERTHYTFTDMSEFFFARAEERFKAYPFLRYGLFNLEEDPYEQGYGRHSYDLVVGANVFHAVQDLGRALDHARSLLAPGGLLLLYETTQHPTWFEVSIGLIEGWSRFNDDWRQGNPLLTPDKWQEALLAHGYEAVRAWPAAGAAAETLGVHIIIAQAPVAAEWQAETPSLPAEASDSLSSQSVISQSAVLAELEEVLPEDQIELLVDFVRQRVIKVTRSSPTRVIGRRDRLMDLGVDSLMAVDLRTVLGNDLGLEQPLPATLIFDYPSIEAIATYLQQHLFAASADESTTEAAQVRDGNGAAAIEEMSDEEVEALLLQKLGEI
jgi:malonyl CoA-acyl carrier protein transacylase